MLSTFRPRRVALGRALALPWTQRRAASKLPPSIHTIIDPEKLKTNPAYPLTAELNGRESLVVGNSDVIMKQSGKYHFRPQIVSPSLCDDVLAYIGPSLEQYRGCDILDINPGAGLWSQKLHDFLQPRRHVLLESNPDVFNRFLEPLVDRPGSTYHVVNADACDWNTYSKLIDDGHFPNQKRFAPSDPDPQKLNTSLLVTGTLMWDPPLTGVGMDSMAKQMLSAFAQMSYRNEAFHAMGPARMLFWSLSSELNNILPKSAVQLGKMSLSTQFTSTVTEVVAARLADYATHGKRTPRLLFESLALVVKRAKEQGLKPPPLHRQDVLYRCLDDIMRLSNGTGVLSDDQLTQYLKEQDAKGINVSGIVLNQTLSFWHDERDVMKALGKAQAAQAAKAAREAAKAVADAPAEPKADSAGEVVPPSPRKRGRPPKGQGAKSQVSITDIPNGKELSRRRASVAKLTRDETLTTDAIAAAENIRQHECAILSLPDGPEKDAALAELPKLEEQLEQRIGRLNRNWVPKVPSGSDDIMSIHDPRYSLQWDARPYEPLAMDADEVWPVNVASLIDVTPRPRPAHMSVEDWEYILDFIDGLGRQVMEPLPVALDRMEHGMAALLDECPSLKDPEKGGRLNLERIRPRMLTAEQLEEIVKAWREWPFRPPEADYSKYFKIKTKATSKRGM